MPRYTASSYGEDGGSSGVWSLIAIVVISVLLILWGWWLYERTVANRIPDVAFGVAFDVSQSMSRDEKQRSAGVLTRLLDETFAETLRVKTWRFAEQLREVDDRYLDRSSELNPIYEKMIHNHLGQWGTRPSQVLAKLLSFAQEERNQNCPVVLCLFTDGEIVASSPQQTQEEREQTRQLAQQIAQMENVKAVLIGPVKEQFRIDYQDVLEPLKLANKLMLFGDTDAQRAIEDVLRAIRPRGK